MELTFRFLVEIVSDVPHIVITLMICDMGRDTGTAQPNQPCG